MTDNEYLNEVLEEMCDRVGAKFKDFDFSGQWFQTHSWTEKEQEDFIKWLTNYLYNNKEAREEILARNIRLKSHIKKAANEFVFTYGWKLKGD